MNPQTQPSPPYHSPPRSSVLTPPYPSQPPHHQQHQTYQKHYHHDTNQYEQLPSCSYSNVPRTSHLHLPGVNTYIEHYHYYNFNGNCTVQQASADGQPNTIRMTPPTTRQPYSGSHSPLEVPPVPPPMSNPLQTHSDHYSRDTNLNRTALPHTHIPPLPTSRPPSTTASHLPIHSSFPTGPRLPKPPPPPVPNARQLHPQPPILPRLRAADSEPPILAPLQTSVPSPLSPLHVDHKLPGKPHKRSRLSRPAASMPIPAQPVPGTMSGKPTPVGGTESNCPSGGDDRVSGIPRAPTYPVSDRHVNTTNSSSPSQSEYQLAPRNEGFERSSSGPSSARATRNADESQSNDWEAVVEMYTTGKGTEDGVALKMITKGDGRRVSDRKLLEKRRTIGKTYECLGVERFERAIGYKWENGVRRKQKMYHVISRCRVVNAMRKSGEPIPTDCDELTCLINGRIAEKEAIKAGITRRSNPASTGTVGGRVGAGVGNLGLGSGTGYSLENVGHVRSGEVGVSAAHGGRSEKDDDTSGRGRDDDEIRPGRIGVHRDDGPASAGRYG